MNRVDVGPQVEARVSRSRTYLTYKTYAENHVFRRGETVRTGKGEFVELLIGESVRVNLDELTNLKLESLSKQNVRIGFGHGRILVNVNNGGNLEVDTPTAEHRVTGRASFIGYDFKHQTSVIPLFLESTGSIQTTIPLLNQTFEVTGPITITDVNPPVVVETKFNEKTDPRKEFYLWAEGK